MSADDAGTSRLKLLAVHGIGPETATPSSSMRRGCRGSSSMPTPARVFSRLGSLAGDEPYDEVQRFFTDRLPCDVDLWADFHAQIVKLAKDICRPRPRCDRCPLLEETCATSHSARWDPRHREGPPASVVGGHAKPGSAPAIVGRSRPASSGSGGALTSSRSGRSPRSARFGCPAPSCCARCRGRSPASSLGPARCSAQALSIGQTTS